MQSSSIGCLSVVALSACAWLPVAASADVFIGSTSNFNNGDADGWSNGLNPDPELLPGGPAGPEDYYMRISSDGAGAGGKLTVFNNSPNWTGLWLTAGVVRVEMDLRNFDSQGRDLHMRLGFLVSGGQNQPGWCTNAFVVPADGQWHHAVFILSPQTMVSVGSPWDWETAMQWVTQLRLFHSVTPSSVGTNFASSVGVDNIRALPSPGAAVCLALAGGLAGSRRRHR